MSSPNNPLHRLFRLDIAQHGDLTKTKFDSKVNLEVISLGLSRTGTTSLQAALTILGFGPCHGGVDLFRSTARTESWIDFYARVLDGRWKAGDPPASAALRELMRGYRSVTDMPVSPLPKEVYAAYPDAKYILSVRADGGAGWFKSMQVLMWHLRRDWWRTMFRALIYPVAFLRRIDDHVQQIREVWVRKGGGMGPQIYDAHNEDVKKLIPPEELLVYDVREGWEPLCRFLEVEVPEEPFPKFFPHRKTGMMMFGACAWAGYLVGAAGLTYLAFNPMFATELLQRLLGQGGALASRLGL